MIIATIKSTVNLKIQSCFGCFNQLFKNPLLSIQGLSVSGVMVSQKTALISDPDCPCLNDYRFINTDYHSDSDQTSNSIFIFLLSRVIHNQQKAPRKARPEAGCGLPGFLVRCYQVGSFWIF